MEQRSKAVSVLTDRIKKEEKTSKYVFLYGIFMLAMIGISMYYRDSNSFFRFDIIVLILVGALFIYIAIIRRGQNINSIITEIIREGDTFEFKTAGFDVLLFFKLKSIKFKMNNKDLKIDTSYYPLEKLFEVNGKVLKVVHDKKEFYIISQYFDEDIKNAITL